MDIFTPTANRDCRATIALASVRGARIVAELGDLFECLTVAQQQAVARHEIDLEDLLERLTATSTSEELCPKCACRFIGKNRFGWCDVCMRRQLSTAFRDELSTLDARREADALKQQVCRDRRKYGINPRLNAPSVKTSEDYGGRSTTTSDEPLPLAVCQLCGEPFRQHDDEQAVCFACVALAAERDELRVMAG